MEAENEKQKAIRLAWVDLIGEENYIRISNKISAKDGYCEWGSAGIKWPQFPEFHTRKDKSRDSYVRPKSLQGIENNNGWIKIESEDDLPKEACFIECISNRENADTMKLFKMKGIEALRFIHHFEPKQLDKYIIERAESYKIIPFKPPIY